MSFLFVDRIIEFIPGKSCRGIKHVTNYDAYLFLNQNQELCFNPSMIGETLGQLAAWNVMFSCDFKLRPVAGVVECAALHRNIKVGETLLLEAYIDSIDQDAVQYHAKAYVGDEEVFCLTRAIGPMLPMDTFISADLIKKQFNEIYRPFKYPENLHIDQCDNSITSLLGISNDLNSDFIVNPSYSKPNLVPLNFDRVIEHDPGVRVVGSMKISRLAPFFPDHFPNKPVLPMTVLLECKINLAYRFLEESNIQPRYKLKELRKIKMNEFVYPGDEVVTSVIFKKHEPEEIILRFRSEVARKRVCVMEMVLIPMDATC